jgi:uncharacterized protein (TIGR02246 family)
MRVGKTYPLARLLGKRETSGRVGAGPPSESLRGQLASGDLVHCLQAWKENASLRIQGIFIQATETEDEGSMNVVKTGLRSGRQGAEWLLLAALMPAGVMVGAEVQSVVVPAKAADVAAAPADVAASPEFAAMIRREMEATVKAFNAADPAGVAALFMEKGELVDENGNVYTGRAEITALFKAFFEKFPKAAMAMEVTSVRSIGDSLAVEEGVRQITAEAGAAEAQMRYIAVRDKVGDKWPIASYREFADDPAPTAEEMLQPLSFLVGDWVDESPEGRTAISYRWSEDGNYILGDYALSVGGQPESKSVQRIGWDPVEGVLRSWTFDSDGGFSHGEWTPIDNGWVAKTEATMPDASMASATVTLLVKDQDHFVVRSTDRIVAGGEEPDFELVIARKPPQPGAAAAAKPAGTPVAVPAAK